jgi:hypothetical protein
MSLATHPVEDLVAQARGDLMELVPDYVYMMVTKDKYELPIAVADSVSELSKITGYKRQTISETMCRKNPAYHWQFRKVQVGMKEKAKSKVKFHNPIRIEQLDMNGNVINVFESMAIAAKSTGVCMSGISLCASGVRKQAGGFKWRKVVESNNDST